VHTLAVVASCVSRRGAHPSDPTRWVFNRLAADYASRPPYPTALLDRLAALGGGPGARAVDLGAGTGLAALPLAARGLVVTAVEPALAMLEALRRDADSARLAVSTAHAAAEETGLPAGTFDLAVLADAAQWVDPARAGAEIARLLAPGGRLALVTASPADTPFMRALGERIAAANAKARPGPPPGEAIAAAAGLRLEGAVDHDDVHRLDDATLEAVLRSLSFVGPALGPGRLAALLTEARALARAHGGAVWARRITLAWSGPAGRRV